MNKTEAEQSIRIMKNGPYIVKGSVPLSVQTIGVNSEGEAIKWIEGEHYPLKASYSLCRCGHSKKHPFCDGSHIKSGFDGTETADSSPIADLSKTYEGPDMILNDAKCFCALARFCDPHGGVWNQVTMSDDPEIREVEGWSRRTRKREKRSNRILNRLLFL